MAATPHQDLLVTGQPLGWLAHKVQLIGQMLAKRLHKCPLPQREPHQIEPAPARRGTALIGNNGDHLLHFATLTKHGVKIARIADQGCRDQLGERHVYVAPFTLLAVMGQPPTRIKRHTEAIDRLAKQQALKTKLG